MLPPLCLSVTYKDKNTDLLPLKQVGIFLSNENHSLGEWF